MRWASADIWCTCRQKAALGSSKFKNMGLIHSFMQTDCINSSLLNQGHLYLLCSYIKVVFEWGLVQGIPEIRLLDAVHDLSMLSLYMSLAMMVPQYPRQVIDWP